ncbi:hypothetical protein DFP72DRAFT_841686 [Ephemerocybe angulata]|uniref:Uncharacterized protein n=1 Tax=Ephemerocybe angulata TaxID=980116 RepID=A0A8H6MB08_9AGAR|nr:hypothetical protein DFP72DRAFT_841686 [Tulosesus angulatus]
MQPEARQHFEAEYRELDELLTNVWMFKGIGGDRGYRVDLDRWAEFQTRLRDIAEEGEEVLFLAGEGKVEVPRWGKTGRIINFWRINEFEVLSVAFRAEVEMFLVTLTNALNTSKKARARTLTKIDSPRSKLDHDTPPHMKKKVDKGKGVEQSSTYTDSQNRSRPAATLEGSNMKKEHSSHRFQEMMKPIYPVRDNEKEREEEEEADGRLRGERGGLDDEPSSSSSSSESDGEGRDK